MLSRLPQQILKISAFLHLVVGYGRTQQLKYSKMQFSFYSCPSLHSHLPSGRDHVLFVPLEGPTLESSRCFSVLVCAAISQSCLFPTLVKTTTLNISYQNSNDISFLRKKNPLGVRTQGSALVFITI